MVFGGVIIDVIIGVVFLYTLLSMICMAINEAVATFFSLRATFLEKALLGLLGSEELRTKIYNSPRIFGTISSVKGADFPSQGNPSYIATQRFSEAIMDMLANPVEKGTEVRNTVEKLPPSPLKEVIILSLDKGETDLAKIKLEIEQWFDNAMERVAGWYKRRLQIIGFFVALTVTVGMNVDSVALVKGLYADSSLRSTASSAAQAFVTDKKPEANNPISQKQVDIAVDKYQVLQSFPIGWNLDANSKKESIGFLGGIVKGLGWLMTVFAIMLGAPFWFDVLNKFINIRLAGNKPGETRIGDKAKSPEQNS